MAAQGDRLKDICDSCKSVREVAFTDQIERNFCEECVIDQPPAAVNMMAEALQNLMFTIPFEVGEEVECWTAGALYDGIGVIDKISVDPEEFGTPAFPSFHVNITEKAYPEAPDSLWYTETCLRHREKVSP